MMCRIRAVRPILAGLVAVVVLRPVLAHPWDGNSGITALALDPQTPTTIYAGTSDRGLFKSTDGAASWSATGLTNSSVQALAIDVLAPATVYAAISGAGVLKSTDGGATWSSTGLASGSVRILVIDPMTPTTLYAVIPDVGVFKSTDGGATWNASLSLESLPFGNHTIQGLVIDAQTPNTLYVAVSYWPGDTTGGEVLKTADEGANWGSILAAYWIQVLAIDPQIPSNVYAMDDANMVYASLDGGGSWSSNPTGLGLPYENLALAVDPMIPTTLYMSSMGGLFKSTDQGVIWTAANSGLTDTLFAYGTGSVGPIAIDPVTSTTLYAGTVVGLFKSADGGALWTPTGLFQRSPLTFVHLDPSRVVGGNPSTGKVTLVTAAPEGGVTVTLSSSDPAVVTVPASVTVAAGATSVNFTVSTAPATSYATVTILGTLDDATRSATLVVTPATVLSSLTLNPATVTGGTPSTGTVTLTGPAPRGGAVVSLSSTRPTVATVEGSVTVPVGFTSADFPVTTSSVSTSTLLRICGAYNASKCATLSVTPPASLSSVSLDPTSVPAGGATTGTVTLTAPAPASGAVVTLSSSDASVASVPGDVVVAAGATSASFTVASTFACASAAAMISGLYGGTGRSATITVVPPTTTDTVSIKRAGYFVRNKTLLVEAANTRSSAMLAVFETSSGALIGELSSIGVGSYRGQFHWPVNPRNVTVRSSLCGSASHRVIPN